MMKELGEFLINTSVFFSDTMMKSSDAPLVFSWVYIITLLVYLLMQFFSILNNQDDYSKYSLIVFPTLLIIQAVIITLMCILCLQVAYVALVPYIVYLFASAAISNDSNENSLYGITPTICTFFNKLEERDSKLKEYREDYKNAIKKSENLWKQHKLS